MISFDLLKNNSLKTCTLFSFELSLRVVTHCVVTEENQPLTSNPQNAMEHKKYGENASGLSVRRTHRGVSCIDFPRLKK